MVMYGAADSDPEIRSLARGMDEQRLRGASQLAHRVAELQGTEDDEIVAELRGRHLDDELSPDLQAMQVGCGLWLWLRRAPGQPVT